MLVILDGDDCQDTIMMMMTDDDGVTIIMLLNKGKRETTSSVTIISLRLWCSRRVQKICLLTRAMPPPEEAFPSPYPFHWNPQDMQFTSSE
jgi:hypothetical protein